MFRKMFLISLILCLASPAFSDTATKDGAVVTGTFLDAASTATLASVVITSHTNRALICTNALNSNTSTDVTSVAYNTSESMTKIDSDVDGASFNYTDFWKLVNPTVTTASVVINFGGTNSGRISCQSFYNVDQTTPIPDSDKAHGSGISTSLTLTSTANDIAMDSIATGPTGAACTALSSGTEIWDGTMDSNNHQACGNTNTGVNVSIGSSWTGSLAYSHMAVTVGASTTVSGTTQMLLGCCK